MVIEKENFIEATHTKDRSPDIFWKHNDVYHMVWKSRTDTPSLKPRSHNRDTAVALHKFQPRNCM
jgi:hypothetical protein